MKIMRDIPDFSAAPSSSHNSTTAIQKMYNGVVVQSQQLIMADK